MRILGVFHNIYGTSDITIGQALLISLFGFGIVFLVLGFLAVFVTLMGRAMAAMQKNKKSGAQVCAPAQAAVASENIGQPLPDNRSEGELVLTGVTEEEAAVIMAVTSFKSKIPLNHLKFNSIRLLEDDKK